ncbi:hypothetical protein ATY48_17510 [Xanthomonas oryzae pv. oryzae]|uniref:Uncharacterized protein n=2 Tax=Xanthomonas oryzae pv. oryzae TaxID=64187 RepID=A0A854DJ81_XANOO|nr:hypothetical protein PXO_05508 [Xanthomonas oryzae pv. oryzae PXO99A]AJQ85417.1 hypothetical protein AZ54_05965 [Xanthomonas oryzae pv. oryzae PXO86]ALZ71050.1 hypothetical protein APZ20_05530 [Xanthomonas oryzae pv. oryzae]AOS03565.1 hypothetical protein ATY42_17375 [Xanthomonas oryzae pv. oryzae]AOS06940.1 hypothetical protein ATY43_13780 [Xanthomonas oryzae pv. oryzae]
MTHGRSPIDAAWANLLAGHADKLELPGGLLMRSGPENLFTILFNPCKLHECARRTIQVT